MTFRNSKLFKMSDSGKMNALIGSYFSNDPRLLAEGYFEAANILVESLASNPSNILVYPIVFLYRHYIELALKAVLYEFEKLGYPLTKKEKKGHNLTILLEKVNEITRKKLNQQLTDETCNIIREFNLYDPNSETFRYSLDHEFNPNIPNHDTVGLDILKSYIMHIEPELYGLVEELRHIKDAEKNI